MCCDDEDALEPTGEDEVRAFELARLRTGIDPDEPLSIELVERVAISECHAVQRQVGLLEREAPDDLDWAIAIVERLAWASRFANIAAQAREAA